jgi:hypothetical protein
MLELTPAFLDLLNFDVNVFAVLTKNLVAYFGKKHEDIAT